MNFESIDPDKLDLPNDSDLTPEKRKELKNKLLGLIQEGYNLIKSTEEKYEEEILLKLDDLEKLKTAQKIIPAVQPQSSIKCFYKPPEITKTGSFPNKTEIHKVTSPNPSTSSNMKKIPISLNLKFKQLIKNTVIHMNNSPAKSTNYKKLPVKPKENENDKTSKPATNTNSNKLMKSTMIPMNNSHKSNPRVIRTTIYNSSNIKQNNNLNKKLPIKLKESETDKTSTDSQKNDIQQTTVIHNSPNLNDEVPVIGNENKTDRALKLPTNNSYKGPQVIKTTVIRNSSTSTNLNKKLPVKFKENETSKLTTAINSKWNVLLKGKVTQTNNSSKSNIFKGNESLTVVDNVKKFKLVTIPLSKLPQNNVKSSTVSTSSDNLIKLKKIIPKSTAIDKISKKVRKFRFKCVTCSAYYSSYDALKRHLKDGHDMPSEPVAPPPFEEVFIKMETHEELLDDNRMDITTSREMISNDEPYSEVISIEDNDSLDSDEMSEILSKLT